MNGNLLCYSLRSSALGTGLWAAGSAAIGLFYIALAPAFAGFEFLEMLKQMPEAFQATFLGSAESLAALEGNPYLTYMVLEYFSFWAPILLGLYALFSMGGTLAREAERGTLGPLLAQPVARWRVATTKYLSFALSVTLINVASAVSLVVGEVLVGIETPLDRGALLQIFSHLLLFHLALGAIALAFSALFMAAGKAWGATGIVLFLSFLFQMTAGFEGVAQAPKYLSLLYYWRPQEVLTDGGLLLQPILVYAGVGIGAFVAALAIFQRREIPE